MNYTFRIYKEVYEEMLSGRKKIEIRLLNEKTNQIQIGDTIKFMVLDSELFLVVKVTGKYVYENVDELWNNKEVLLDSSIYSNKDEFESLLNQIFGEEKVLDSKIVGIEFELI